MQLLKKLSAFYGTLGSLLRSQLPTIGPCPEPYELPSTRLYKIHVNIILPSTAGPLKRFLPFNISDHKLVRT
jgi:hypothetical protein